MQISLLPVVTIMIPVLLVAASTDSTSLRGGLNNHEQEVRATDHWVECADQVYSEISQHDELLSDTEYERICDAISLPGLCDEASSFRVIERYDECTQQDEYAVGAWTADPGCCNIGPDECARLGVVPSTCDFDAGDVSYWHCLFCCEM